jgi:hypothetical protein
MNKALANDDDNDDDSGGGDGDDINNKVKNWPVKDIIHRSPHIIRST